MRYLLLFVAVFLAALAISAIARAEDSITPPASPSPSPSPTATVEPVRAPQWVVDWARKWERNAHLIRPRLAKAKWCFSRRPPVCIPREPARSCVYDVWRDYGRRVKNLTVRWRERFAELRHAMVYPGGWGSERWRPLVKWHWPAYLVDTAIYVIRLESGGNPNAVNSSSGAAGLFQLYPAPAGWRNPDYNVYYAYRVKYCNGGWRHWVVL